MSSSPWSYCYRRFATDDRYNISCLQFWYKTDSEEAGLGIKAGTGFNGQNFYFKSKFQARKWNHFCILWNIHNNAGNVQIFLNGHVIGSQLFASEAVSEGILGSDEVFESYFILGQEPDVIGPPYEVTDLFNGKITELNFWDKILDGETILKLATCLLFPKGNIISWSRDNFRVDNAGLLRLLERPSLCKQEKNLIIFPEKRRIEGSRDLCAAHGGKIFTPKNKKENEKFVNIVMEKRGQCIGEDINDNPSISWIGVKSKNYTYYETNDGLFLEQISYSEFSRKPSRPENDCAILKADGTWESNADCFTSTLCTVCEFVNSPPMLLRGFCYNAWINWVYFLSVDERGEILYDGYKSTRIQVSNKAWIITERTQIGREESDVSLPFEEPRQYPIGTQEVVLLLPSKTFFRQK